jgi:outer membrane protein OmpA-like peptidoglycan-associated protein
MKFSLSQSVTVLLFALIPVQGYSVDFFAFLKKKRDHSSLHLKNCEFHLKRFVVPTMTNGNIADLLVPPQMTVIQDIDGDGIPDKYDDCPASFGLFELKGCPPVNLVKSVTYGNSTVSIDDESRYMLIDVFSSLQFEGEYQLLSKKSEQQLDKVVQFMKKHPKLYLYISSYFDSGSNRMRNYYMSEYRVNSVEKYLLKKKIAKHRIGTLFFGDLMPVVDLPPIRFEVEICDRAKAEFAP